VPLGDIDTVITLCEEQCALPPSENLRQREAWALPDPADATGSEQEMLTVFRSTRDEIRRRIHRLVG
jgi:arsenate reductase